LYNTTCRAEVKEKRRGSSFDLGLLDKVDLGGDEAVMTELPSDGEGAHFEDFVQGEVAHDHESGAYGLPSFIGGLPASASFLLSASRFAVSRAGRTK
jgi:hypothetical protein